MILAFDMYRIYIEGVRYSSLVVTVSWFATDCLECGTLVCQVLAVSPAWVLGVVRCGGNFAALYKGKSVACIITTPAWTRLSLLYTLTVDPVRYL